ncbi:iron-siderophore ABC transporter substrate-binding protein [Kineococcus sp. NPDC059986]|uniref:iron-siderophore ABC transporter substrate-binding protein n=1 Tax=Kineococcus sp. NPDC059986 TaxID=3155538 RepID=UPI00344DC2C9
MRTSRRALLATVPVVAFASACGSSSDEPTTAGASASGSAAAGAFPVTIEHELGKTTVKAAPQRIVCLGWGSQDVLWALGLQPVGIPEVTWGGLPDGTLPWWAGHFDKATTTFLPAPSSQEIPFEQIAALTPDLVLAVNSGITAEDYSKLTAIAPTVGYPKGPWLTTWQESASMIGKAVGKSAEAEKLVADTEDDLANRAAATPSLKGKSFVYVYATTTGLSAYLPGDARVDLMRSLGMVDAPGIESLAKANPDEFYVEVAKERVRDIDSQVLVGYGEITRDELRADPVYATMPAVAADAVAYLDDKLLVTATSATVLSVPWLLDRLVPMLDAAAQKAPTL